MKILNQIVTTIRKLKFRFYQFCRIYILIVDSKNFGISFTALLNVIRLMKNPFINVNMFKGI